MEDHNYCVYMHVNKINGKKYVGITGQIPKTRWANGKGYNRNRYFNNAINKYGWDNFEHIIIESKLSEIEAKEKEIYYIELFSSNKSGFGYNLTNGGEGIVGFHHSEETKEKLRQKSLNMSPEQRISISEAHKGIKESEETKQKQSLAHKGKHEKENNNMYGKHHTEEVKQDISNKLKGKYIGSNNWFSKKVICITTGQIFDSLTEASKYYNIAQSNIMFCCKGKTNSCGKLNDGTRLQWKYYNEGETYLPKLYINTKLKPVKCVTTNKIFESIKEAQEYYQISYSVIIACCKGRQKYGGKLSDGQKLIWAYVD